MSQESVKLWPDSLFCVSEAEVGSTEAVSEAGAVDPKAAGSVAASGERQMSLYNDFWRSYCKDGHITYLVHSTAYCQAHRFVNC